MKKIKLWAKRPVNTNFLFFMIIAVVLAVIAGTTYLSCLKADEAFDNFGAEVSEARSDGEIDDVEGYGIIFGSLFYGIGAVGVIFKIIFMVFLPLLISISTAVQAVACRIIYSAESKGRLFCYRIFSAVCGGMTALMTILFSFVFFDKAITVIIAVIADIALIAGTVFCFRNTFTDRIKG